jgi:hypothetical protein
MNTPAHPHQGNRGVQNSGAGTINITGSAIGDNSTVRAAPGPERAIQRPATWETTQWDVGVITVLSEEPAQ